MIALDNSEASILGTLVLRNQTYRERANVHHFDFRKSNYLQPLGSHLLKQPLGRHLLQPLGASVCEWMQVAAWASGCKWLQLAATDCSHLQRRGIFKKNDVVDFTFCSRLSVVDC